MAKVLDVSVLDFLSGDSITVNQSDNKIAIAQNYATINTSEKLIEQYEERIKELKEQIEYWKSDRKAVNRPLAFPKTSCGRAAVFRNLRKADAALQHTFRGSRNLPATQQRTFGSSRSSVSAPPEAFG